MNLRERFIFRRAMSHAMCHVMLLVSTGLLLPLCLAGCESEEGLTSGDYPGLRGENRVCTGAFTPHSTVCWDDRDTGDGGGISADMSASQENMSDIEGQDRCAAGIIGAPGTAGKFTVSFTTTLIDGLYAPRNCGAVWLEDSFLFYVRTLEVWTHERQMSLVQWDARVCKTDVTLADAISGATLAAPAMHTSTWDTKDFRGNVVPDGTYTLWLQVASNEIFPEGPFAKIPITKGSTPYAEKVAAQPGFSGIVVTYTPDGAMPAAVPQ